MKKIFLLLFFVIIWNGLFAQTTDEQIRQAANSLGVPFDDLRQFVQTHQGTEISYNIGDKGPAGGLIFYDKGNNTGGWRYLEAAPADLGKAQWQSNATDVTGTKDNIGTGKQNTQLIGDGGRAALLCQQYSQGGYRDWFLPSKSELDLMHINLKMKNLGNFSDEWYWSSSQNNWETVWTQRFSDGHQTADNRYPRYEGAKGNAYSVRACRQF